VSASLPSDGPTATRCDKLRDVGSVAPLVIPRLPGPIDVTWTVPGSKSITNRALVLAALADGETRLTGALESDDTRHMRAALTRMGIDVTDAPGETLIVRGGRARLHAPDGPIFVGNSGTTVRFLAAVAALVDGETTLVGDDAMAKRPIHVLVDALRALGADVSCATGCPPLTIRGGRLRGGRVRMCGDQSSQYFSALLMAAGFADADLDVEIEGSLVSRPYVDITRRMIADFGGEVTETPAGFHVRAGRPLHGRAYAIEPDASSASYRFALAAALGGAVVVPGLGRDAQQGDYAFAAILEQAGAQVTRGETSTRVERLGTLRGVDVDMHHISDTVMTLAAIAPIAAGPTRIRNVANIRIKETDRLAATVIELERLGQRVTHGADWLAIEPAPITPAMVHCYDDHRIAMSFAILGAAAGGVTIEDPACVSKTYPAFFRDLAAIYATAGIPFTATTPV
jgi:3-phosphoshikimate 1-carboxyvinyltransferase